MSGLAYAYEGAQKYGTYAYKYGVNPEPNYVATFFILWGLCATILLWCMYAYWDELEQAWNSWFNRKAIRSATIKLKGKEADPDKIRLLTKDFNKVMEGGIIPNITEKHRINASKIVGMSTTPGIDCLFFTIWYKR